MNQQRRVAIVAGCRTPFARAGTAFRDLTAVDLARACVRELVERSEADPRSIGMVVMGYDNTIPVTIEEIMHHCRAVVRGAKHCLVVGDMPFMSYQVSVEDAVRNAGRLFKETDSCCPPGCTSQTDSDCSPATQYARSFRSRLPISIDGSPSEWSSVPGYQIPYTKYVSLTGTVPPTGNGDCSAVFKSLWDGSSLYVLVQVTDDAIVSDSAPTLYRDDSVELCLDGLNEGSAARLLQHGYR